MGNFLGSSEFALAMGNLAHLPLASQPNGTESGAWKAADTLTQHGQGLAQQEALKKARKEAEKQKKGALGGSIGSLLGTAAMSLIPGVGPFAAAALSGAGGMAGGMAGSALTGGKSTMKDSAVKYGLPALADGLVPAASNKLGDLVMKGTTHPALTPSPTPAGINNPLSPEYNAYASSPAMMSHNPGGQVIKPFRHRIGSALKKFGSEYGRMPTNPDGSYTFNE